LSATAAPGIIVNDSGTPVPIDELREGSLSIYVPAAPDMIPSGAVRGRFIFLPGFIYGRRAPAFLGRQGEAEPFGHYSLRPLTYVGRSEIGSGRGLRFRLDGNADEAIITGYDSPGAVPGLYPLVEDETTRALGAKYAGHDVWRYGDGPFYAGYTQNFSIGIATDTPVRMVGIYRAHGYPQLMAVGSPGTWVYPRPSTFLAIDPLILAVHVKPADVMPALAERQVPPSGPNAYWFASDEWDLERSFSLSSMESRHPGWTSETRNAIRKRQIKIGMTRDMVAWSLGYPSTIGTITDMNKLNAWYYDEPTPAQSTVKFHDGRVTEYDPPGRLP
jgi:hypothetical protein